MEQMDLMELSGFPGFPGFSTPLFSTTLFKREGNLADHANFSLKDLAVMQKETIFASEPNTDVDDGYEYNDTICKQSLLGHA